MSGWTLHNQGADAVTHQYSLHGEDGVRILLDVVPGNARAKEDLRVITASYALLEALKHAVSIIETHVPKEALGFDAMGDADVPGGLMTWPILEEYLHHMKAAIALAQAQQEGGQ